MAKMQIAILVLITPPGPEMIIEHITDGVISRRGELIAWLIFAVTGILISTMTGFVFMAVDLREIHKSRRVSS